MIQQSSKAFFAGLSASVLGSVLSNSPAIISTIKSTKHSPYYRCAKFFYKHYVKSTKLSPSGYASLFSNSSWLVTYHLSLKGPLQFLPMGVRGLAGSTLAFYAANNIKRSSISFLNSAKRGICYDVTYSSVNKLYPPLAPLASSLLTAFICASTQQPSPSLSMTRSVLRSKHLPAHITCTEPSFFPQLSKVFVEHLIGQYFV
ncbi:hypothetical protein GEMRC1_007816 [Eukaryota sp. GEM-RC1]